MKRSTMRRTHREVPLRFFALSLPFLASLMGCGQVDPTSVIDAPVDATRQSLVSAWIGPVSEESNKSFATCGSSSVGVTAAQCRGSYCDDMYLYCSALPAGVTTNGTWWTSYISEEGTNSIDCELNGRGTGINGVIDGITATGSYADNVAINCARFTTVPSLSCFWTPWFSEEHGAQLFAPPTSRSFAVGIRCGGSYCDNVSYHVCRLN